jgi:hypothetical protein
VLALVQIAVKPLSQTRCQPDANSEQKQKKKAIPAFSKVNCQTKLFFNQKSNWRNDTYVFSHYFFPTHQRWQGC